MTEPSRPAGGAVGPRAKCDQVVYEAIAKAAEIVVRSRCHVPPSQVELAAAAAAANSQQRQHHRRGRIGVAGLAGYGGGTGVGVNGGGGSSSRFNLEVEEVDSVR